MVEEQHPSTAIEDVEGCDTIRGDVLGAWASSPAFLARPRAKVDDLLALDALVAPFVCDESHTNNFSRSAHAAFYRHLIDSFPMIIDMLLDLPEEKNEAVRTMLDSLATEYVHRKSTPGGTVVAQFDREEDARLFCAAPGMLEAARALLELSPRQGESRADAYDRNAKRFDRDTGCMAPGKDVPAAMGQQDEEAARAAWAAWLAAPYKLLRTAIAAAERGEGSG